MSSSCALRLFLALLVFAARGAWGDSVRLELPRNWQPNRWYETPLSPRIASYSLFVALDWQRKALEGKGTITWRNMGTAPTAELPLHLYMNAFKGPQSLFHREGRVPDRNADAKAWGWCRLLSAKVDGILLDGHAGEDETVHWLKLPRAVKPGESIAVEIAWETQFPKARSRTGWGGHFLMAAQWFPKAGVYQGDRWTCHAYHRNTEFFSDFGVYDVELSLPNQLVPAHTGTSVIQQMDARGQAYDARPDPDRKLNFIWKLHAEDVHDFAWAVMPRSSWRIERFDYRGVQVFYFFQPQNRSSLKRLRASTESALRLGSEWFVPYPYPVLTVVDVPDEAQEAAGMEYPTLITTLAPAFDPIQQRMIPEEVTVHETGHQWFYGMLASDEIEHTWLDEGFTSWFTARAMERTYQAMLATRRFQVGCDIGDWMGYRFNADRDPLSRLGFRVLDGPSYSGTFYGKGSMVLAQLEAMLGRPRMMEVMGAYAREMAFRHPTPADFRRIAERVSGRDLSAFWRDFIEGTEVLDVVLHRVDNVDVLQGGWMDAGGKMSFVPPQSVAPGRRGSVTLLRKGSLRLPITLWVRLENRTEHRLLWDGQDRWTTFEFDSPVAAAILDPDGNYPMLLDRLHASWTAKPARRGLHYWAQMLWGGLTGMLQGIGIG